MKLSILMPIYNEKDTLEAIYEKIRKVPIEKEIIMVDDGSTDGTRKLLDKFRNVANVQVIFHAANRGKGAAIRTAIEHISGDIVIIQDADLEYEPADYLSLIAPIRDGEARVVYGSRFLHPENPHSYARYYWGGRLVTFIANILFAQKLTDEPTCYKVFDAALLKRLPLKCEGFEFCPEVTARIAKEGIRIKELPIRYFPRSIKEGKKIRWFDGINAIWTLIRYRFTD